MREVVAFLSEATWHARFGPGSSDASFREMLLANQSLVASAVVCKVTLKSYTNVVLHPDDFVESTD